MAGPELGVYGVRLEEPRNLRILHAFFHDGKYTQDEDIRERILFFSRATGRTEEELLEVDHRLFAL